MNKIISVLFALVFTFSLAPVAHAGQDTHHKRSEKEKYVCSVTGKPSKVSKVREMREGVIGNGETRLRWNDSFRAHLVEIEYGYAGSKKKVKKTGDDGAHTFKGLTNGRPVEYRIRGVSNCGKSAWSKKFTRLP